MCLKQKTAYEHEYGLVGAEMGIRDSFLRELCLRCSRIFNLCDCTPGIYGLLYTRIVRILPQAGGNVKRAMLNLLDSFFEYRDKLSFLLKTKAGVQTQRRSIVGLRVHADFRAAAGFCFPNCILNEA